MNHLLKTFIFLIGIFVFAGNANALSYASLNANGTQIIIPDESDDAYADYGTAGFWGILGDFSIDITGGLTHPALETRTHPEMNLLSSNSGPGTFMDFFSETDFDLSADPSTKFLMSVGRTFGGTATFETDMDRNNGLYNGSNFPLLSATLPQPADLALGFPGGLISAKSGLPTEGGPVSTLFGTSAHSEGQYSDLSEELNAMPEPTTMLLFGSGLIGLAALSRNSRRKSTKRQSLKLSAKIE